MSTGTFFGLGEHPVLRDIESRISAVTLRIYHRADPL